MLVVQVGLDDFEISFHHVQGRVTEHLLQGVDVAAVAQELDGKGVAKAVRVDVGDEGALPAAVQDAQQGVAGHGEGLTIGGSKERRLGREGGGAADAVLPEGATGWLLDAEEAAFVAFSLADNEMAGGLVVVGQGEGAQLGGAQATVEQGQQDGVIAQGGGALAADGGAGAPGFGLAGGAQQGDDLVLGKRVDGRRFGFGALDAAHGIGGGDQPLVNGPGEQG